jgi:RND family efflux transporter MFP subunit
MPVVKRRGWIGVMAAALIGAVAVAWVLLNGGPDQRAGQSTARAPTPVVAQPVAFTPQQTRIRAIGTARAVRSVTLYPASDGEVVVLDIDPGSKVQQGDVLLKLDDRQAALDVQLAQVAIKNAQQLLARYERIKDTGAVSASTIDTARNDVEAAMIELKQARETLRDRTLRAPFDGYVGLTDIDVGDRITTSTAVTTLDDRSTLLIDFQVPETYIERVAIGSAVSLRATTLEAARTEGGVTDIDSRIDPVTRTVQVRAGFNNKQDRFRPGMSFEISMDFKGRDYPSVPEIALQWGSEGAYLWTIEDGLAQRVPALVIERQDSRILVDADIEKGDLVVVEGMQKMRDGLPVRVDPSDIRTRQPIAVILDPEDAG